MPFNSNNEWEPNKKQAKFISLPFTIREGLYGGGAGSGKSELLLMLPIVYGFHKNPRFKQLFLRRTTKQLKKEIVPRSYEIYPKFGGKFNESDMVWTFPRLDNNDKPLAGEDYRPTGSRVYLGHCENESDVHIYDSMEINLFTPDEITSLTEYIYLYIGFTRVRSSDPNLPAIIRAAGMPGDVGHSFVKKRFVDPYPFGGKVLVGKGGNKRVYIQSTLSDNPHIDPTYRQGLEALPEAEKQAKLYGSWDAYLGQVFEEFRDKKYPDEPDNALHVIPEFAIPSWWPKILAIDWGMKAMCSVGWGAISPDKKLYVYRHQPFYGKKIEEWAPAVKYWVDRDKPSDAAICFSANQHRGDPHTIFEQVSTALGISLRLGERDRVGGKLLVHEYLRWRPRPIIPKANLGKYDNDNALWILRNKGIEAYDEYARSFSQIEEVENIPRLLLFDHPDIKLVGDSIKACVYEKEAKDGKKKEDVAEFDGDDPYDMLRMLLHAADGFFSTAIKENEKLERTAELIKQLESSNNMHRFYMQSRRIDDMNKEKPAHIRIGRHSVRH